MSKFKTSSILSIFSPAFSPNIARDATINSSVKGSDLETFIVIFKHLIDFSEKENGKWHHRFSTHPELGLFGIL